MVEADSGVLVACLYKYTKCEIPKNIGPLKLWLIGSLLTLCLDEFL